MGPSDGGIEAQKKRNGKRVRKEIFDAQRLHEGEQHAKVVGPLPSLPPGEVGNPNREAM